MLASGLTQLIPSREPDWAKNGEQPGLSRLRFRSLFLWVTVILMHHGYARIVGAAVIIGCDGCDDPEFGGCAW